MYSLVDLNLNNSEFQSTKHSTNRCTEHSTEQYRIDNIVKKNIIITTTDAEFMTRLFDHLPIMREMPIVEYDYIMSGNLVRELVLFEDQEEFFKPISCIELYMLDCHSCTDLSDTPVQKSDTPVQKSVNKLYQFLKCHCSNIYIERTKQYVSFSTNAFKIIIYLQKNLSMLDIVNKSCNGIIWTGHSILMDENAKYCLENKSNMYSFGTSNSDQYLYWLELWFIRGIGVTFANEDDFKDFQEIVKFSKLDSNGYSKLKSCNKLFTAKSLSIKLPTKSYQFPVAYAHNIDETNINIFQLQPKMTVNETCKLLRLNEHALSKVLTKEEIKQAENDFMEAIQEVGKKYANIITDRLNVTA